MSESNTSASTIKSWPEAHDAYCRRHRKRSLRASIHQVLHSFYGQDNDEEDYEIPWRLPNRSMVVTEIDQITTTATESSQVSSKSYASMALSMTYKLASGLYQMVSGEDEDLILHPTEQPDDDDFLLAESSESNKLDWKQPIVHVDMTQEAVALVTKRVLAKLQQGGGGHLPSSALAQPTFLVLDKQEWKSWLDQSPNTDWWLSELAAPDANFLLDVLVAQDYAKILQRPANDLILLSSSLMSTLSSEQEEVQVSLYDLQTSKTKLEGQLHAWTQHVQTLRSKARDYHKQGQKQLALTQLARAKTVQRQIDTSSNTLLTLENLQTSIEVAQSNQGILQLLQEGSQVLKGLSQSTTLEEIEQVKEDLDEQIEHAEDVHATLTSGTTDGPTDEELLEELAALTISDTSTEETSTQKVTEDVLSKLPPVPTSAPGTIGEASEQTVPLSTDT